MEKIKGERDAALAAASAAKTQSASRNELASSLVLRIDEVAASAASSASESEAIRKEVAEHVAALSTMKAQCTALEAQIADSDAASASSSGEEMDRVRGELDVAKAEAEQAIKDTSEIRERARGYVEKLKAEKDNLAAELDNRKSKVVALKSQLATAVSSALAAADQAAADQPALQQMASDLETGKATVESQAAQLHALEAELSAARANNAGQAAAEGQAHTAQMADLTMAVAGKDALLRQTEMKICELEGRLEIATGHNGEISYCNCSWNSFSVCLDFYHIPSSPISHPQRFALVRVFFCFVSFVCLVAELDDSVSDRAIASLKANLASAVQGMGAAERLQGLQAGWLKRIQQEASSFLDLSNSLRALLNTKKQRALVGGLDADASDTTNVGFTLGEVKKSLNEVESIERAFSGLVHLAGHGMSQSKNNKGAQDEAFDTSPHPAAAAAAALSMDPFAHAEPLPSSNNGAGLANAPAPDAKHALIATALSAVDGHPASKTMATVDDLSRRFSDADTDGNGKLSLTELEACLLAWHPGLTDTGVLSVMSTVEEDRDGKVTYDEFKGHIQGALALVFEEEEARMARDASSSSSSSGSAPSVGGRGANGASSSSGHAVGLIPPPPTNAPPKASASGHHGKQASTAARRHSLVGADAQDADISEEVQGQVSGVVLAHHRDACSARRLRFVCVWFAFFVFVSLLFCLCLVSVFACCALRLCLVSAALLSLSHPSRPSPALSPPEIGVAPAA